MAINTYATLKTAVANWLGRDQLTSRIPEFIALAEQDAALRLRIRAMEASTSLTVNAQTVALPTRFVSARRLYIDGDPVRKLEFMPVHQFWETYMSSTTGKPRAFTIEGENFVFGPTPDTSYTGKLLYWQAFAALSADGDTNWLITNAVGVLLYGALVQAAPFMGDDPRILTWASMHDDVIAKVEAADKRDRFSGSELRSRSAVPTDALR